MREPLGLLGGEEGCVIPHRDQGAVAAAGGPARDAQVDVGGVGLLAEFEVVVDMLGEHVFAHGNKRMGFPIEGGSAWQGRTWRRC